MTAKPEKPGEEPTPVVPDFESAQRLYAALEAEGQVRAETPGAAPGDFPQFAGYLIEERLGEGGGGEVFRAMQEGSQRPVAIKLLHRHLGYTGGPADTQRAWRELHLLSQLRLPCLPRVLDYGEHEGRLYIVTDFIDGAALDAHCTDRGLDRAARVDLLARVADAVQAVHEKGVIHRDVKPENVIINAHGQVVLVDLGIATLIGRNLTGTITAEGAPIGSPAFMAPEQARGEREAISTRSDVYGLGATAYDILAGGSPFDTDTTVHEAIRRVAQDEPRDPRDLDESLPKALAAVLRKAAARDPGNRYSSAAGLAADLRRWLKGDPVEAGGLSIAQRAGRLLARHPIAATAAVCAVIFVLTLSATSLSVWYVNIAPYEVRIDSAEHRWAQLVARSGRILHGWDTGHPDGIMFAELVDRDPRLGGGRIVVIGFARSAGDPTLVGRLCAFSLTNLEVPIWTSGTEPPRIAMPPPKKSHPEGEHYGITRAAVHDVFARVPGDELVAIHPHAIRGATAIRIYDMGGSVLYEAWHDGRLINCVPIPGTNRLAFCGLNSAANWAQRGKTPTLQSPWPFVVFALVPALGREPDWIRTVDRDRGIEPAWYRCVVPSQASDLLSLSVRGRGLGLPTFPVAPGPVIELAFSGRAPRRGGGALYLDEHGNLVHQVVTDDFRLLGDPPEITEFGVDELPPIVTWPSP